MKLGDDIQSLMNTLGSDPALYRDLSRFNGRAMQRQAAPAQIVVTPPVPSTAADAPPPLGGILHRLARPQSHAEPGSRPNQRLDDLFTRLATTSPRRNRQDSSST